MGSREAEFLNCDEDDGDGDGDGDDDDDLN